jgi:anti-anti-sigma factor
MSAMLPDPQPSAPRPGKLLPGLLLLAGVFLGFLLLAVLNGMLLYPLVALTFRPEVARVARPWLAALSFVLAILEIVAYEWLRAVRMTRLSRVSPGNRGSDNEQMSDPKLQQPLPSSTEQHRRKTAAAGFHHPRPRPRLASSEKYWITWEESQGVTVVRFTTLDFRGESVIPAIFEQIEQLLLDTGHNNLVLDFSGIDYFPSYAIGKLLMLNKRLQPPQDGLALCCLTDVVEDIFDVLRLRPQFKIYRDEQEAIESFARV